MNLIKTTLSFILIISSLLVSAIAKEGIDDVFGNNIILQKEVHEDDIDMSIFQKDKNGKETFIYKLSYFDKDPGVHLHELRKIENKGDYLIVSLITNPGFNSTGIPYVGDYFMYYLFRLNSYGIYEFDKSLSDYFGQGGDIYDLADIKSKDEIYPKIIYSYPFKNTQDIDKELNSSFFKRWDNGEIKDGVVIKKTLLQDVPNYVQDQKRYLIKGDRFHVKSVSARWLEIVYKNSKGKRYTGWILCKDTSVCE
ncbi:hypothetical protein [Rodentibacter pneumotropicus]|uniref:hypothetical protein n=1 Tax=Rodentibacter pneumotropicus TaxID=758 RepID=UPI000986C7E0|nr:hypothetical protein [Rodentibacter pneumotropicus]OOF60375.1 hypothetical protein BKL50_10340 [Rodentibacter pneumotropicus]